MTEEKEVHLITETGEAFDIPEGGSLGLLALGYSGIMMWREKRHQIRIEKQKTETAHEKT